MIEALYPHGKLARKWPGRPGCRIKLRMAFRMIVLPYCPLMSYRLMNKFERLWGLMHEPVMPNKCHERCGQFADATLDFFRGKVPKNRNRFRDSVATSFRVINPKDFRVMARTGYT